MMPYFMPITATNGNKGLINLSQVISVFPFVLCEPGKETIFIDFVDGDRIEVPGTVADFLRIYHEHRMYEETYNKIFEGGDA